MITGQTTIDQLLHPYVPSAKQTIAERLGFWAAETPDGNAYSFLEGGEGDDLRKITFLQLHSRAVAIAEDLIRRGLTGKRALLLYPPGLDFIEAFFGCLYAGVTAVPGYPPRRNRSMDRIEGIANDADAAAALSIGSTIDRTISLIQPASKLSKLNWVSTDNIASVTREVADSFTQEPNELAMLQYTSGSTGSPKGVMLTHKNIMHNCSLISYAFQSGRDVIGCSWLPTYHDMGLIGGVLNPLFVGRCAHLMSPMMFMQRPIRWLRAISNHKVTISGGPNFAYDLCTQKITDEEMEGLDLSSWKLAFNGAEPVRKQTIDNFAARFEPFGFRKEAFYPCYGMAETTLLVTGGNVHTPAKVRALTGRLSMKSASSSRHPTETKVASLSVAAKHCLMKRSLSSILIHAPNFLSIASVRFGFPVPASRPDIGTSRRFQTKPSAPNWQAIGLASTSDRETSDSSTRARCSLRVD